MKAAGVTLLLVNILVLTVFTSFVACYRINEMEVVMDNTGEPVKPNNPYFIRVANTLSEKWVSRSYRYSNLPCPQVVVLSETPMAVIFFPESGDDYIPLDSNISIKYEKLDQCSESGIWRADKQTPYPRNDISAAGSLFSLSSTFKIQKDNDYYKFVYDSENIGVYTDQSTHIDHLVLNTTALDVIFVLANPEHKTSSFLKTIVPFI